MCWTCDFDPCLRSCPEAYGFSKSICSCSYCHDSVYRGDNVRVMENGRFVFHEDCLSEMRADELADFLDVEAELMQ